jgi:hypothetical protein
MDMNRGILFALMLGLVISMYCAPIFATDIPGSTTISNVPPEATSVAIKTMADVNDNTLNPQTQYKFIVTVRDNNNLTDVENILLKLYTNVAGENATDAVENHYTFLFKASDNTWTEIGPSKFNEHLTTGLCVKPSELSVVSDEYKFVVNLSPVTTPTTGGGWTVKWIITDDNGSSGSSTKTFDVNEYLMLMIDDAKLTISAYPGQNDLQPTENPTIVILTANYNFNVQCKLSGDLIGETFGDRIPMSNIKAAQDESHMGEIKLSDNYSDLWSNVEYGELIEKDIYWFADIPFPLMGDTYTADFYVRAIKYT